MSDDKKPGGVSIGDVEGGIHGTIIAGGGVTIGGPPPGQSPAQPPTSPGPATEPNLAILRQLLLAAFTSQSLRRFCQDRPAFRPVVDEFGPGHGLNEMVDRVIDYCETQLLFDDLLAEVKAQNPRQYARFEADL